MSENRVGLLTDKSIDRKVTVLVIFMTTLVVGIMAAGRIPMELMPSGFTEQFLRVIVPWRDAPAQEVLEKITLPMEEELATVRGLSQMSSYSRSGRSAVYLSFKGSTDMSVAYREVRDRVERARAQLPDDADRVFVYKDDVDSIPLAVVGIAVDQSLGDPYDLLKREIIRPIERIDGVASVSADGLSEKEITIEIDRFKAESAGLNIYELAGDLGGDNFTMASGNVHDAGKKFLLRSVARYNSLTELENRPITRNLRLKDIAEITYAQPEKRVTVRANSKPAFALIITKEGDANTVAVSRKVDEVLAQMAENPRLEGVDLEKFFNQGTVVESSISNLVGGGKIGGILAALVLFLFLRRFRLTVIITLSIPLSLLVALIVMHFSGESLNLLTILGLVICVGLLVDNSVVVAENIHRRYREGLDRREACVKGTSEIALAILTATLTTMVVFLPMALVEGEGQFFMMRLALPICVALGASLFVAMVFIPLCVYLTLHPSNVAVKPSAFQRSHQQLNDVLRTGYDATFGKLNHLYARILTFSLNHRLDLLMCVFLIGLITILITPDEFFEPSAGQEDERSSFYVHVDAGREISEEDIAKWFGQVEELLENHKADWGIRGYFVFFSPRGGRFTCWLDPNRTTGLGAKQIQEKVIFQLPEKAGLQIFTGEESQSQEEEDSEEVFVLRLQSEDADKLEDVAQKLEPLLVNVAGVLGVKRSGEDIPNEMALVINRDQAVANGVNPQVIAGMVSYALRGNNLPRYNENGREIPVRIRYREEDRERLDDLTSFSVPTAGGGVLPISALTESKVMHGARGIFRREKQVTRTITLELYQENAEETRQALTAITRGLDLPEGVRIAPRFNFKNENDADNMIFAFWLSIIFIYLLMCFLFESFLLPISILPTIPLAFLGVIWSHMIAGMKLDLLGMVGMVLLVGVVVNNGIVLIDYVNRLRKHGLSRAKALVKASEDRFRPIMMTALTTIIGMIPLTISERQELAFGEGISYKSFGMTLIGGMTTTTVLTLLVVPILYSFLDDASTSFIGAIKRVLSRSRAVAQTESQ